MSIAIQELTLGDNSAFSEVNITNQLLAKELLQRGYKVRFLASGDHKGGLLYVEGADLDEPLLLKSSNINANVASSQYVAKNKLHTAQILQLHNLPAPKTTVIDSHEIALAQAFLKEYRPIVVKPLDTNQGMGITVGVSNNDDLQEAIAKAGEHGESVLLQQMVKGVDHRLLVVNGQLIAAARRLPACVVGDGKQNISQLIEQENTNPLRGDHHDMPLTKIDLAESEKFLQSTKQRSLKHVPTSGEIVWLTGVANLSMGGTAEDVTDIVHPKIKQYAIDAAKAANLAVTGVDIMTTDIAADPDTTPAYIIELNDAPGIRMHHFPSKGQARDAAKKIIDFALAYHQAQSKLVIS